ncbi:TetR/AcrR family transcriptional regulator [Cellulomonas dongxiuzhuiae]|uniref:TetR family transcriptional regulator n=1 Tax=Cellulomonas dongxiuzhuiae TaxID=2819979 RepID=A0ABX8GGR6_9CELL|nr:TetR family transcriptional regulator [Cellulomonas dongxiuzhuiae]MBO3088637.1 TetR family transcriptional regulator [Cellulomonas dongxiuzhuiae]MBO3094031.1 TetR family transcriptional regulator [Cellulomonas dongxiuzhuiae]QWC15100.1 TetR family transcriptional regulator [Cellulomonas dongxiuzhuiae]
MSSTPRDDLAPNPDLTTRARIRDAAVARYAREGFGVGLRAVAEDAGVSAALILHHFGSKDGLRAACDAHVLRLVREGKERALVTGGAQDLLLQLASMDEYAPLVGYALRTMQAGGAPAREFVEHFVADAEVYIAEAVAAGSMRPSRDEKARARYLTVQGLGALLLDMTLHPPDDPTDVLGVLHRYRDRMMLPAMELFTHGLMTDDRVLDAYLRYVDDAPEGQGPADLA